MQLLIGQLLKAIAKPFAKLIGVGLVAIGSNLAGRRSARKKQRMRELENADKTNRDVTDTQNRVTDRDSATQWLRQRKRKQRE